MEILTNAPLLLDFDASNERLSIRALETLLENHPAMKDPAAFQTAVWERQCLQPPVLGNGIALPHARTPAVSEIVFAIGRLREPVPFGGDREPVRLIFLYGTPPGLVAASLAVVAALVKKLHRPEVVEGLLEARDEEAFKKWLD